MCIRDSCYLILCKAQYIKKDYETAESSFRFFLDEFDPLKNCLLYTSDAADERSSVDLGGRRIIKKKKNI